jgi:hypothetical protein
MVRIDGYVALLCLLGVAAVLAGIGWRDNRRRAFGRAVALVVGAAATTLLGWLDVHRLSPAYYQSQISQLGAIGKAAIALVVLAVVVAALLARPVVYQAAAAATRTRTMAVVVVVVMVGAFLAFLTRPHWQQTHSIDNSIIATTQRLAGMTVDGTRTYSEQTLHWQAMYMGWPVLVLAVVGYCVLLMRLLRGRDLALLGILSVGLSMSALYLWTAQITPDQVWAMRRYVPVVIPAFLIAATYVLAVVWSGLAARRADWVMPPVLLWTARACLVALGLSLVWTPWRVTQPVWTLREEVPQLTQVQAVCAALPSDAALLIVDDGLRWGYAQTMRAYCDVATIALVSPNPATLAAVRTSVADGGRTLYVMSERPGELTYGSAAPTVPFSKVTTTRWPSLIGKTPTGPARQEVDVYLATIGPDGRANAVNG